jgi:hypothetical protein
MAKNFQFSTICNILFTPFQEPNFDHIKEPEARLKAQNALIPNKFRNLLGTDKPDEGLLERLKSFATQYDVDRALVSKLLGENFTYQPPHYQTKLAKIFDELNSEYGFFKDKSKLEDFIKCYKIVHYYFEVLQNSERINIEKIAEISYRIIGFFGENDKTTLETLDKFIAKELSSEEYAIETMGQYSLPNLEETLALSDWYKLRDQSGKLFLKHFHKAQEIQKANNNQVPKNKKQLEQISLKVDYPKYASDENFAKLSQNYKVPNYVFEAKLKMQKIGLLTVKTSDLLPNTHINIENEYHIMKLPAGDARGFILGYITNCCQSLFNASHQAVVDGMCKATNGFYVLVKAKSKDFDITKINWSTFEEDGHQILGQAYAWFSTAGNLVLDSWENLRPENHDKLIAQALPNFATKIIAESKGVISRVTIGLSGKTPADFKTTHSYAEYIGDGYFYGDATQQAELASSNRLLEKRAEIREKTRIKKQDHIISLAQANIILSFSPETLENMRTNYEFWSDISIIQEFCTDKDMLEIHQTLEELQKSNKKKYDIIINSPLLKQALLSKMISFKDMVELDISSLEFLNKPMITEAIKFVKCDLKTCIKNYLDQIEVLSSEAACMLYMLKNLTLQDIAGANKQETLKNIAKKIAEHFCDETELGYIDQLSEKKLSTITSKIFTGLYQQEKTTLNQMATVSDEVLDIITNEKFLQIIGLLCIKSDLTLNDFIMEGYDKLQTNIVKQIAKVFCKETNVDYIDTLPEEYISLLISEECVTLCILHNVKLAKLAKLSHEQISALFSSHVPLLLIHNYGATLTDFVDESTDQMKRNIAEYIAKWVCKERMSAKSLDIKLIEVLISPEAVQLYSNKSCKISELISLCETQASNLLRDLSYIPFIEALKAKVITIQNLIELVKLKDYDLFNAMLILITKQLTFKEFKQIFEQSDETRFDALFSVNVVNLVLNDKFTFAELRDLYSHNLKEFEQKIKLGNDWIWLMVKENAIDFNEIKTMFDSNITKFEALTSDVVRQTIEKQNITFEYLKNLYDTNPQEFARVTLSAEQELKLQSWHAQEIIKNGFATPEKLKDLLENHPEKFDILLSSFYQISDKIKNIDLIETLINEKEKFEKLTSWQVKELLDTNAVQPEYLVQLIDTDIQKFEAITAYPVSTIIKQGGGNFEYLENLYDTNREKFNNLAANWNCRIAIESYNLQFNVIESFYDHHTPEEFLYAISQTPPEIGLIGE